MADGVEYGKEDEAREGEASEKSPQPDARGSEVATFPPAPPKKEAHARR
jgi:hypothetical protein